ncbi:sugar phosphate permease [Mycolicibacterium chubuense NBB4]|uniref:Sugar phosphate permease n=1 Tax=Mycolicibacterium chubuense (strain NBB4) TaxID=710421 RepID=I4BJE9_MYCCN|nr:MFS transporter [Mycolicibacterium chubuense]AFM17406.1 sugar phosphate permease [Mycolicibacterium chubuense NBB4]
MRHKLFHRVEDGIVGAVGGPARFRVIGLLALVLGLDSANNGTIGAIVVPLKAAFHISNTQVGLLATLSAVVGTAATVPCGALADRVNRTRMLWIAILAWSAAMAVSGAATGYLWLLICRLALGLVVAVAGPVVASLIGDYFAAHERGRIYGFVLAGEMVGAAAGLVVSGGIAGVTWRLGFWWLAAVGLVLAVVVAKFLPEPQRGGGSRIAVGATEVTPAGDGTAEPLTDGDEPETRDRDPVATALTAAHVPSHPQSVLQNDPRKRSLWWAMRYIVSIRTNLALIVASSLGYFFLTGLGTFGMALLRGRFHLGQFTATILVGVIGTGALLGVLSAGRLADWLVGRGHFTARIVVAGTAMLAACVFAAPALASHTLTVMVPLAFVAAIGLGGSNPPLDAARLDIVPSALWGRAEAVRTVLRSASTAIAPLLFGYVSTRLQGPGVQQEGAGSTLGNPTSGAASTAVGLVHTFLIMLIPLLLAAALILLVARRTYPRDVATALGSEDAMQADSRL